MIGGACWAALAWMICLEPVAACSVLYFILPGPLSMFNPRRMRRRVTVVVLCVSLCLSVTTKSVAYLVFTSQTKFYRFFCGVFNIFTAWLSLKMLRSRGMASFAGHHFLPRSLANFWRPNEIAMASFQFEKYIWLVIDPTTRLVHRWSY